MRTAPVVSVTRRWLRRTTEEGEGLNDAEMDIECTFRLNGFGEVLGSTGCRCFEGAIGMRQRRSVSEDDDAMTRSSVPGVSGEGKMVRDVEVAGKRCPVIPAPRDSIVSTSCASGFGGVSGSLTSRMVRSAQVIESTREVESRFLAGEVGSAWSDGDRRLLGAKDTARTAVPR
jgi:hypothetical protein